jgi:uncharacterized protein (TIGR02996 family)
MTDQDALLRAVCEAPEDNAPRLIYADWLDEHGDPMQAEFIRQHIAMGPRQLQWWGDREAAPIRGLWNPGKWRFVIGDWLRYSEALVDRGFHTKWSGSLARFVELLPTWWRFGPVTELDLDFEARFTCTAESAAKCGGLTQLTRLSGVTLQGRYLTDEWIEFFVASPEARNWRHVELTGGKFVTDRACEVLAASPLARSDARVWVVYPGLTRNAREILDQAFPDDRAYASRRPG